MYRVLHSQYETPVTVCGSTATHMWLPLGLGSTHASFIGGLWFDQMQDRKKDSVPGGSQSETLLGESTCVLCCTQP